MDWLIFAGIVAVFVTLGVVAQRRGWIDVTGSRRGSRSGAGVFGSVDEVFAPTRHEAQVERDRQASMPAPAPLAGDGDKGIFTGDGPVRITLSRDPR